MLIQFLAGTKAKYDFNDFGVDSIKRAIEAGRYVDETKVSSIQYICALLHIVSYPLLQQY